MTRPVSSNTIGAATPSQGFVRLTGLLYLLAMAGIGLVYGYSQMLPGPDAAIIGIRIGRSLFELAILGGAAGLVCYLLAALAFYRLFQHTGRKAPAALLLFVAASVPLSLAALARMLDIVSLVDAAAGMTPALGFAELRMPVMLALHSYNSLMLMSALFWGLWLIPLGWLVYRSRVAPRVFGIALMIGSLFYLLMFAGTILDPDFESSVFGRITGVATFVPAMVGELGTCLWLIVYGWRRGGRQTA